MEDKDKLQDDIHDNMIDYGPTTILIGKLSSAQAILETNQPVTSFILKWPNKMFSVYRPTESNRAQFNFDFVCVPLRPDDAIDDYLKCGIPYDIVGSVDGSKVGTRLLHSWWLYDLQVGEAGIDIPLDDPRYVTAKEICDKVQLLVAEAKGKNISSEVEDEFDEKIDDLDEEDSEDKQETHVKE